MSKLQKKPSALKRGHPTLKNMNFYKFFPTFGVIFTLLDPDPDSESGFRIRIHWPDWIRIQSGSGSETLTGTLRQTSRPDSWAFSTDPSKWCTIMWIRNTSILKNVYNALQGETLNLFNRSSVFEWTIFFGVFDNRRLIIVDLKMIHSHWLAITWDPRNLEPWAKAQLNPSLSWVAR
jgi:hypothetical protein